VYDQDDLGFDNKPVPHKSPSYYVKRDNQTGRTEVYKASEYGYSGEPTIYDKPVLVIESEESTGW
jgi:hypothetical protein